MNRINYLLELYPISGAQNPLGDRSNISGYHEIYVIQLKRYSGTYWTDWGGYYDNPVSSEITLFYGVALTEVSDQATLISTENSFWIDGEELYIHLSQYNYYTDLSDIQLTEAEFYTVTCLDKNNPSQPFITGTSRYKTILDVPSFNSKLSDDFSGVINQQTFNVSLNNDDGSFDDAGNNSIKRYINAVCKVKKTIKNNPTYASDWSDIMQGTIDDFEVDFNKISFSVSDKLKTFDQPVCTYVDLTTYPDCPAENVGKKIPIAFNQILGAPLIQIDEVGSPRYIFVNNSYFSSLDALYDDTGALLTAGVDYSVSGSTITMLGGSPKTPGKVDFTGSAKTIGSIITTQITAFAGIDYISDNWDLTETNVYVSGSPIPGIFFDGDNLKSLIDICLKNDTIYLITLPSGKMTIRHFWNDEVYPLTPFTTHTLDARSLVSQPMKRFSSSEYWLSVVKLIKQTGSIFNEVYKTLAESIYSRSKTREFESNLYYTSGPLDEAVNFAEYLAKRFYLRREILELSLGISVLTMKLLDNVSIDININGRQFTRKEDFKITAIDYAQDKITIEEL